ncbi:Flagellar biosynthesis protein, FliO [Natronincola peptidivorans]|uniref:Flagellar biosynthesis protein, FliO n=1 Tax=Natronincola peptidivorans TaxID=426128 RepID=A0A1H9YFD4_9FIRM|nr:flagellar biosynthetic protein FliO [Natronincola peptidivorans]SES67701.1 Flagellar biosynthesis protein, FliO [Natronincola peptidivorans]
MLQNIYTVFTVVSMIIIVIFMAYFVTSIIGKKTNFYFQGRSVKVLERTALTAQLTIMAIQVLDKVYILAVQSKNIEVIDTLDYIEWIEYKKNHEVCEGEELAPFIKRSLDIIKKPLTKKNAKDSCKKGDKNRNHERK